jgi:hypothetical protein
VGESERTDNGKRRSVSRVGCSLRKIKKTLRARGRNEGKLGRGQAEAGLGSYVFHESTSGVGVLGGGNEKVQRVEGDRGGWRGGGVSVFGRVS